MTSVRPGDTFGSYEIGERIGVGGMGVVHLATDTRLGRKVALKLMSDELAGSEEFLSRFHQEADALARLDSPHIITIFDHGEVDGTPYIATQYVAGGDLGTLIRQRGRLPLPLAADVCAQIAEALHDAHEAGVIHRDVKTSNVLIRDPDVAEPFAYLCDFGIAKQGASELTQAGGVAGSWAYLSPERTKGERASRASDVYALGCLLHACITGHAPYSGSDVEIALAHSNEPIPQFEEGDRATALLNAVLRRSLAKAPGDRYATAAEMRADLLALRGEAAEAGSVRTPVPGVGAPGAAATGTGSATAVRSGRTTSRTPWLVGAVALALIGVGGGVWALTQGGDDAGSTQEQASEDESRDDVVPPSERIRGDWDGDGLGDARVDASYWDDGPQPLPQQLLTSTGETFEEAVENGGRFSHTYAGDVNGDGRLDQVLPEDVNDDRDVSITLWLTGDDGPGEPTTQEVRWDTRQSSLGVNYAMGDFTGDGLDDLLLTRSRTDDLMIFAVAASNGAGFDAPVEFGSRGGRVNTLDKMGTGDFDGDGIDDVVVWVTENSKSRIRVLRSTGTSFRRQPVVTTTDARYGLADFVGADIDGDGADELVSIIPTAAGSGLGTEITARIFAQGTLGAPETLFSSGDSEGEGLPWMSITASDVDGDGDDDIIRSREYAESGDNEGLADIEVYINDDGELRAPQVWGTVSCGDTCGGAAPMFVENDS